MVDWIAAEIIIYTGLASLSGPIAYLLLGSQPLAGLPMVILFSVSFLMAIAKINQHTNQ